jgi:hypothetical protein
MAVDKCDRALLWEVMEYGEVRDTTGIALGA